MIYSIPQFVSRRLSYSATKAFAVFVGLVVMAALVSCGPLYPGDAANTPDRSSETHAAAQSTEQASLLVRRFKLKNERDISSPQYRQADEYMRVTAPAVIGVTPSLFTHYAQTEHMPIVLKGDNAGLSTDRSVEWGFISFVADFESHVRILEGRLARPAGPTDTVIEAVMMTEKLDAIGAKVGDRLVLVYRAPGGDLEPIEVKIVGRWAPTDPDAAYWFYDPPYFDEGLMVPEATYFNVILPGWENIGFEYAWHSVFDVQPGNKDAVNTGVSRIRADLANILGEVRIAVWPPDIVKDDEEQSTTQ